MKFALCLTAIVLLSSSVTSAPEGRVLKQVSPEDSSSISSPTTAAVEASPTPTKETDGADENETSKMTSDGEKPGNTTDVNTTYSTDGAAPRELSFIIIFTSLIL